MSAAAERPQAIYQLRDDFNLWSDIDKATFDFWQGKDRESRVLYTSYPIDQYELRELRDAAREVYRLSERKHDAWDRLAAALAQQVPADGEARKIASATVRRTLEREIKDFLNELVGEIRLHVEKYRDAGVMYEDLPYWSNRVDQTVDFIAERYVLARDGDPIAATQQAPQPVVDGEQLPPSCGPAETLSDETLVEVALQSAGRNAMYDNRTQFDRMNECKQEIMRRLAASQPQQGAVACHRCNGRGVEYTGIDESPTTVCEACDGSGARVGAPTIGQQAVDVEVLRAFERKFWQAVSMTDSRDFDHDVCKEVRDFRDAIAALAAHGKGG